MAHRMTVLDGFNRPLQGRQAVKARRKMRRNGGKEPKTAQSKGAQKKPMTKSEARAILAKRLNQSGGATKKPFTAKPGEYQTQKQARLQGRLYNRQGGSQGPTIMDGFNRKAADLLQGYNRGTREDRQDWRFLVDIEHPVVLNGFENFLELREDPMQGPKRKERKQRRQDRREANREQRTRQQDRKERRKEAKTAKKEEKLRKKMSRREEREKDAEAKRQRKAAREARKLERQRLRAETKQFKAEHGGGAGEQFLDTLTEIGTGIGGEVLSNLVSGEGAFTDLSYSDVPGEYLPGDVGDVIDEMQDMDAEDALMTRDVMEEELPPSDSKKSNMGMLLGLGALGVVAATSMGGDKKKRKK